MNHILPHLPKGIAFEPQDLIAMSMAFDDVCKALKVAASNSKARETSLSASSNLRGVVSAAPPSCGTACSPRPARDQTLGTLVPCWAHLPEIGAH